MPLLSSNSVRCCLAAALALTPVAIWAQERLPNGRLLTFGTSLGLGVSDNPDLDETGSGRAELTFGLDFGLIAATPIERFEVASNLNLQALAGGADDADNFRISDPNIAVSYQRRTRGASFDLDASASISNLETISPLDFSFDEDLDPEDLRELEELAERDDLGDEATRLSYSIGAQLKTGLDAPLGATYALSLSGTRYDSVDSADLEDLTRLNAGLDLSAQLSPVLEAGFDLDRTFHLGDERDDRQSVGLDLIRTFRTASLGLGLNTVSEGDDTRTTLAIGGGIQRPLGTLSGNLGITQTSSGEAVLVGDVSTTYALAQSQINASLARRVSFVASADGTDDLEQRTVTLLTAGYARELTRVWSFELDAQLVHNSGLNDESATTSAELGGSLSRSLTPDWAVSLDARHRIRSSSGDADADSSRVSVSLNRTVQLPF